MTAATRNRIRQARSARVREQVAGRGGSQNDPTLDRVVWLPYARLTPATPSVFQAQRDYEGRLAA